MSTITAKFTQPAPTGRVAAKGQLICTPSARATDGDVEVVLPAGFTQPLEADGTIELELEEPPATGEWWWCIREDLPRGRTRFVKFDGDTDYNDLEDVDPSSGDPAPPLAPVWREYIDDQVEPIALSVDEIAGAVASVSGTVADVVSDVAEVAGQVGGLSDAAVVLAEVVDTVAARGTTELAQRLTRLANGALPLQTPSGQAAVKLAFPSGNVPQVIGGKIGSTFNASSGTAAWYVQSQLDDNVSRIGARWTIDGPNSGTFGIIAWADDYGQHLTPSPIPPDSVCHLAISKTGWEYQIIHTNGTFVSIGTGTFAEPLVSDGATVHTAEVVIDRANGRAYVHLPDGTTATVSHALIKTLQSRWAVVEDYRQAPANSQCRVVEWWADSDHPGQAIVAARARALQYGAWQTLTLVNSWANSGGVFAPLQCRREGPNMRIRGSIKSGGTAVGTMIAQLPLPPDYVAMVPVVAAGGTLGCVWVLGKASGINIGQLQYIAGGNTQLILDFTYPVAVA